MQRENPENQDAAWRAIVANFGERARLDPTEEAPAAKPEPSFVGEPVTELVEDIGKAEGFVPEEPPPVPVPPPDRMLAWLGVFGSPAVLLVFLVLGLSMPTWLGWLLAGGFVAGFCYLIIRMPGAPRDPWDDGARV